MRIESGDNRRCVDRAISTIKMALGMPPETSLVSTGLRNDRWVATQFANEFPDRDILMWGRKINNLPSNLIYRGPSIWTDSIDLARHIVAFGFKTKASGKSAHMVIGVPPKGYGIGLSLAVAVPIERRSY